MKEIVNICAYKATENNYKANRLHNSHVKIMDRVGLSKVTSLDNSWIDDPEAYFITAELASTNEIIAGARVQLKNNNILPIEEALSSIGKNFSSFYSGSGIAEFCGLWISKKFASLGFSCVYIANATIALSVNLNATSLVGICAKRTADIALSCGFDYDYSFGNDLMYPFPDLPAYVIAIKNLKYLPLKLFEQRSQTIELINSPVLSKSVKYNDREVEVNYDLSLYYNEKANIAA